MSYRIVPTRKYEAGEVFLITIYDKAERESISVKELENFVRENGLK